METKLVRITPAVARELLKQNTSNRHLRPSKIAAIKQAYERGEYQTTHQGIAFSTERVQLDGQHRLHAIAAMPDSFAIDMLVTTGLPPSTWDVIDTLSTPRSASDVLRKSQGLTAVGRFIIIKLVAKTGVSVTPIMLKPYISAIEMCYDMLIDYCPTVSKTWSSASIRTAAILRMMDSRGDRDYIMLTYHALIHADFDSMSPIAQALYRQQTRGTVNSQSLDLFVRAFRVFDIRKMNVPTVQITDQDRLVGEACEIVNAHILGQKKAPSKIGAKVVNNQKFTARP